MDCGVACPNSRKMVGTGREALGGCLTQAIKLSPHHAGDPPATVVASAAAGVESGTSDIWKEWSNVN
jgi:hypothetical protein